MKVALELRDRAKAVTFTVTYTPTETQNAGNKHAFWTALDKFVEEAPKHEQPFALMDANARISRRKILTFFPPTGGCSEGLGAF